jgi:hypothetical protein
VAAPGSPEIFFSRIPHGRTFPVNSR